MRVHDSGDLFGRVRADRRRWSAFGHIEERHRIGAEADDRHAEGLERLDRCGDVEQRLHARADDDRACAAELGQIGGDVRPRPRTRDPPRRCRRWPGRRPARRQATSVAPTVVAPSPPSTMQAARSRGRTLRAPAPAAISLQLLVLETHVQGPVHYADGRGHRAAIADAPPRTPGRRRSPSPDGKPCATIVVSSATIGLTPARASWTSAEYLTTCEVTASPRFRDETGGCLQPELDDVPVVTLTLHSDDRSRGADDLERVAHALEVEIKRVPGTREVQTLGGPGRAVRVLLDADRLHAHGVSALDVRNALELANVSAPSGKLYRDNREIVVETGNYLESAADVRGLVVGVSERRPCSFRPSPRWSTGPTSPRATCGPEPGRRRRRRASGPPVSSRRSRSRSPKKPGENAIDVADRGDATRRRAARHGHPGRRRGRR